MNTQQVLSSIKKGVYHLQHDKVEKPPRIYQISQIKQVAEIWNIA